jgi:hypothetical protein
MWHIYVGWYTRTQRKWQFRLCGRWMCGMLNALVCPPAVLLLGAVLTFKMLMHCAPMQHCRLEPAHLYKHQVCLWVNVLLQTCTQVFRLRQGHSSVAGSHPGCRERSLHPTAEECEPVRGPAFDPPAMRY